MVLSSPDYRCSNEVLTIVSMLSVPQVFMRPKVRAHSFTKMPSLLVFQSH